MTNKTLFAEITLYNKLRAFEVDLLSIMVKHFCDKSFHNKKPQFKFQRLVRTTLFHHFFFNIGGIDYKVSFSQKEIDDYLACRIKNGYKITYFRFWEKSTFVIPDYEMCDFWDVLGGIEFDKKKLQAEEKKLYGTAGYVYVKIRRLFNK